MLQLGTQQVAMLSSSTAAVARVVLQLLPPLRAGDLCSPVHHSAGACNKGIIILRTEDFGLVSRWRSRALSKPSTSEYSISLIENGLPAIKLPKNDLQSDNDDDDDALHEHGSRRTRHLVEEVKAMFGRMADGEISISAYDTAWVALVKHSNGIGGPQFPEAIRWIVRNQLSDGSWGDAAVFSAHDRMINTLACVIALKSWNIDPDRSNRGVAFIQANMWRLGEEEAELMPIGFEVAFPSLMDIAKALELKIPYGVPALKGIYAKRDLKLRRIPKDVMHEVPTTLLHSLEGMRELDWESLLPLQCPDGSFLFSPSSTAYALMQTGNEKCLEYLQSVINRFGGGVPNVYPVDLFEHLWAVDRLERLGIERYFEQEIKHCLDYVFRYWTEDGICWARNSRVSEVDDTSMGFRLLRLHGYEVSAGVFRHFERSGEFFCFARQSNQAVTGMYNLNRAAQVGFPGEEVLQRAKSFTCAFLREKQSAQQLVDKWIITKDLAGEVEYALEFPWFASLPRVETRLYLEQYGGDSDVWIGKTLYRMPLVSNDVYLELAKLDFRQCQALHQSEWIDLERWYEETDLRSHGVSRSSLLKLFFLATASIYEADRWAERLGWARTAAVAEAVSAHFRRHRSATAAMRQAFVVDFLDECNDGHGNRPGRSKTAEELPGIVRQLVHRLVSSAQPAHLQQLARHLLQQAWKEWLLTGREETGLLLVRTIEICAGRFESAGLISTQPGYDRLAQLLSSICRHLALIRRLDTDKSEIQADMQKLAQLVLQNTDRLSRCTKRTFLQVAKTFYYSAHCSPTTIDSHISMVLFLPLD